MTDPQDRLPPLDWLRAFEAAARRLNFTAAAAELGLTQAAVSQHIRLLEARLGVPLFRRLPRGVALTPEGAAYLPHMQAAFAAIAHSTAELFGRRAVRKVTIQSPVSFAVLWLAPRLASFAAELPGIEPSLSTAHLPADHEGSTHDFDIRFGLGDWPGRAAYRLTAERLTPVAAPALVPAGDPAPGWWHGLPRLTVVGPRPLWPDWFALEGLGPRAAPAPRFDSFVVALAAARAGAGVLLGSRPLVDGDLESGALVRLSPLELAGPAGHFVTNAAGAALSAAQDSVLRWFRRQAGA
jgi:DNA-binding transcriptional LysR family regulator